MTKFRITLEVENVDPTLIDPQELASDALDHEFMGESGRPIGDYEAEWVE